MPFDLRATLSYRYFTLICLSTKTLYCLLLETLIGSVPFLGDRLMKLTTQDVKNVNGLIARARDKPILFEEMRELIRAGDAERMMARTEMCHLSNGWLVMFNFEYQRPNVLCKHLSVGYTDAKHATVYATSRIMQILGFEHPLRVLPGWDDTEVSERYPVVVNVVEPVNVTLAAFQSMTTGDDLADPVVSGGSHFSH